MGNLSHLDKVVPKAAQGNRISSYTIALEAWRRGLKVTFYNFFTEEGKRTLRYKISDDERELTFSLSRGPRVSDEAFNICDDKARTKKYLEMTGVPYPQGIVVSKEDFTNAKTLMKTKGLSYPVVIKPTNSNAGKGVFANINSDKDFRDAINVLKKKGYEELIIEEFVQGKEYRFYVIEEKVIAIMLRDPASVVGDGKSSISELIDVKNRERKNNPHLSKRLIIVDEEIEEVLNKQGKDLDTIPKNKEKVYLRVKSNLSTGGESVDKTHVMPNEYKDLAIKAGQSIPGLNHFGLDMIIDDKTKKAAVLEINTRPGIGGHLFPVVGEPVDVATEIVNYYFPKTINWPRMLLHFDFNKMIKELTTRKYDSIQFSTLEKEALVYREIFLKSELSDEILERKFKTYANSYKINGYIDLRKSVSQVVMAITPAKLERFLSELENESKYIILTINKTQKSILKGFQVITAFDNVNKKTFKSQFLKQQRLEEKIKMQEAKLEFQKKELEYRKTSQNEIKESLKNSKNREKILERELLSIKQSKSWRYTSIFRRLNSLIK